MAGSILAEAEVKTTSERPLIGNGDSVIIIMRGAMIFLRNKGGTAIFIVPYYLTVVGDFLYYRGHEFKSPKVHKVPEEKRRSKIGGKTNGNEKIDYA